MSFIKLTIRQSTEGNPGFMEPELISVQINTDHITLFNDGDDGSGVTFVRLSCGATLCVDMPYVKFIETLNKSAGLIQKKIVK